MKDWHSAALSGSLAAMEFGYGLEDNSRWLFLSAGICAGLAIASVVNAVIEGRARHGR